MGVRNVGYSNVAAGAMQSHHESNESEKLDQLNSHDEAFDLSGWESEEDSPPPPQDDECLAMVSVIHRDISAHTPIDNDEDWSDVDIDLPNNQKSHRRVWNDEIRNEVLRLFLVALQESRNCSPTL